MFTQAFTLTSWKVTLIFRETDEERVYYFATEALAQLAVEWAYAVHVEALRARADASDIEEVSDPTSGSWKIRDLYGKKVTWWKKVPKGYIAMKDYFTAEAEVFERTVIGSAA